MGTLKILPKTFTLTLAGVSIVSLVLAPSRALSPRLVVKQLGGHINWANEDDSKAMETTSRVRQRLRASFAVSGDQQVDLEIEPSTDREIVPERMVARSCEKEWGIALFLSKQNGRVSPTVK